MNTTAMKVAIAAIEIRNVRHASSSEDHSFAIAPLLTASWSRVRDVGDDVRIAWSSARVIAMPRISTPFGFFGFAAADARPCSLLERGRPDTSRSCRRSGGAFSAWLPAPSAPWHAAQAA